MTLPKGYPKDNSKGDKDRIEISKNGDKPEEKGIENEEQNKYSNNEISSTPYSFNGKVIFGIGAILAISALSTIFLMTLSKSPQINLSVNEALDEAGLQGVSASTSSATNSDQKVDRKFVLIQKDFGWNGTNKGPLIRVTKGDTVQITIINAGQMAHNFGIAKLSDETKRLLNQSVSIPSSEKIDHIPYNAISTTPCPACQTMFEEAHIHEFMKPLTQTTITFTVSEKGQFKYFCMVRGHLWLGMMGDFVVEESFV